MTRRWHIIQGPDRLPVGPSSLVAAWSATVESQDIPAQRRTIRIEMARTLLCSDRDGLMTEVREALDTNGQSAVERFLDMPEPPTRIVVSATAILPLPD